MNLPQDAPGTAYPNDPQDPNDPHDPHDPQAALGQLARAQAAIATLEPVLAPLAGAFTRRGESLYLVGGSVRDALLGRLGHDLDFTTSARPAVIAEILGDFAPAVWDTGIEFGTVSAEKDGQLIEITTFRSDTYDGQSRNPDVRFGDTLDADLIRRDFTVNAMAVELRPTPDHSRLTFEFHDPQDGFSALRRGELDTPAAPEQSFSDDPLRMLRAARFTAQLGLNVAPRVEAAMTAMAPQISRITAERIRAELDKLMAADAPWDGWDLLVRTGIADIIMPEVSGLALAPDEHLQHKDVYAHSMTVLRQAMDQEDPDSPEGSPDLILRWAALLHDCGKPDTRAPKPGGGVTFHHHEVVGAKLVRRRLRALKYPKNTIRDISQLVYLHMRFHGFGDGQWTDSAVRRYVTDAGDLLPRLHKLVRADCTTRNKRKARMLQETYDHLETRIAQIQEKEDLARVRPDLDGNEIMSILGLKPGPEVGRAWSYLKELRLDSGPLSHDEAVDALKRWWAEQD
ncbi:CCA tRNA nucleotidyltransferase [Corynebacterium uberis]|uniref:CCA tRNA nucleotidyltransferase n=1 Tax=Corynebacterium TaxID=1716 RepID=UPI001D0A5014|nr:CCA tRNA nucleotidyltransferase [Corynebacterium uberis]UDL73306.1 CCA tRNA nucleotidyltransferase [Corynebacterium uberis]UDL75816.1 CCA tRNA nucleotidyltransferase [Corynebacterium uberis]UDL78029.1 CCA tRNA nucleotidyltransferase [Corynebacterium uberis]UDL80311.1 CCA tRNA nucleotidyltransferase [Corynebacterium uberis]UDL82447.1 CCA tRNA nucleotidyltransferase [Corynebacterium uberis]